jgi:hypothetical protein
MKVHSLGTLWKYSEETVSGGQRAERIRVQFPAEAVDFSHLHSVQTGSGMPQPSI